MIITFKDLLLRNIEAADSTIQQGIFDELPDENYNKHRRRYNGWVNRIHKLLCRYFNKDVDIGYSYAIVNRLLNWSVSCINVFIAEESLYFEEIEYEKYLVVKTSHDFYKSLPIGPFHQEESVF